MHLPSTWRLPFGWVVEIRQVSPSYLRKMAGECRGFWMDFGSEGLPEKLGRIYLDKTMDDGNTFDTLRHEMQHALTDWGGKIWQP